METQKNIPTVLLILGATGDLMHKKIIPALYNLYEQGKTPKTFHIIGFSRRDWKNEQFQQLVREILTEYNKNLPQEKIESFVRLWAYHRGEFGSLADYETIARELGMIDKEWNACSNKLFYIAAPPQHYRTILTNLKLSQLTKPCSPEEGYSRVLIEKPFGKDLATAEHLDSLLSELFREEQIYRIDHYLAKEMLQNILSFRFSNALFQSSWSNKYIEKVTIRVWETLGVEKRGSFYDGLGTLRDVGQNHLLQMLALITMQNPGNMDTVAIRDQRAQILRTLVTPSPEEVKNYSYRAQYKGFRSIAGVNPATNTETYFKLRAFLNHPDWRGVPFIIESGKRMGEVRKEIIITFKHPSPCLCPPGNGHIFKNRIIFEMEPSEGVFIDMLTKKPGLDYDFRGTKLQSLYREGGRGSQYVEEYEKLLLDAIEGDQTLFVRSDEVRDMWRFTDPYVVGWEKNPSTLGSYASDTNEPVNASLFIDESQYIFRPLPAIRHEAGIIGLGKMGKGLALRLIDQGWRMVGFNRTFATTKDLELYGLEPAETVKKLVDALSVPRILLLSLPAGKPVDEILFGKNGLAGMLGKDDTIIDLGNSYYEDSIRRAQKLKKSGVRFIDVGISGGPDGARNGASLMIGGRREDFEKYEALFRDLSVYQGYGFFEGAGAGHFVKMIHNGIEYGMMQAIAEGFAVFKKAGTYRFDLRKIADVYNHGSVIESKLMSLLEEAYELYGAGLEKASGIVARSGEGDWTVKTAKKLNVKTKVIADALKFRIQSQTNPDYIGKVLTALRNRFGGHALG